MHRYVRAQVFDDPLRHLVEFLVRVVFAGDQERRRLEPGLGLFVNVLERLQHRSEVTTTNLVIETVRKGLEIHVGGIHCLEEFFSWLRVDIAGRDRNGLDASLAAGFGDVHGVLEKDDRVIVGVRDALAAELLGCLGEMLGARTIGQRVHFTGLGHVPVLAELAGEIAACRAEGQHAAARVEMIKRLFLDRVDAEPRRAAVRDELDLVIEPLAHIAQAALALAQAAMARAKVALQPTVRFAVPVLGLCDSFLHA